jgi:DNA-binding winged helix-turn-helix (wHTH) protein
MSRVAPVEAMPIVLAKQPDFRLGELEVSPARLRVATAGVVESLQPRIMQVLVALAERRGDVVTRDELMARCWNGTAVSDDAIHRCIARLRRLSESHGGFALETVTRVGYQLVEDEPVSRTRYMVALAVATVALVLIAAGLAYIL